MVETRKRFHEQLAHLEQQIQVMGRGASDLFRAGLATIEADDLASCEAVVAGDDSVDALYIEIEQGVVELFALQGPVASDLRLLAALLHINLHLERIADMAVNVAKITAAAHGLPQQPTVLGHLRTMGAIALEMLAAAMDALERRDNNLARALPTMDEPLDDLNRGMLAEILTESRGKPMLEWGVQMHLVSRQIERVGDHAVDIGEQVAYLVTGVFEEFTDASHPEVEANAKLTEAGR
ncbi:MAG TPA: phosphate signaling complex protein PhoU [Actinomycetota bacterium]|nr:phosphate signaling complex protein PhoU [Actinomycetota bacterium]